MHEKPLPEEKAANDDFFSELPTPEQIAEMRRRFVVDGKPLDHGLDVYEHFTPEELVLLNEVISGDGEVGPEGLRVLAKYTFLIGQLPVQDLEAEADADAIEGDWERLQAALKREGLLQPKKDDE
jgi:hypothetical protein